MGPSGAPARAPRQNLSLHRELPLGGNEFDTAAQLRAYFGQFTIAQPAQFTPLQALQSRLGEFQTGAGPADASPTRADDENLLGAPISEPYRTDLAWFEKRFGELRHLLNAQEESRREMAVINEKLSAVIGRLDVLAGQLQGASAFPALDDKLTGLARSLDETRERTAANADQISRAAAGILAANSNAHEDRRRFEIVARNTVEELGETVAATASRAAILTAEEISSSLARTLGHGEFERLEAGLGALHAKYREAAEKTTAAIERVHETLHLVLGKGLAGETTRLPRRKRPSVLHPISADSSVYNSPGLGFGSGFAQKPQLGTITLRDPAPSDPNLLKALQEAEENLKKRDGDRLQVPGRVEQNHQFSKASRPREEEKNHPLSGVAVVGIILLLVAGALYYLHARAESVPFRLSVLPSNAIATEMALRGTVNGDAGTKIDGADSGPQGEMPAPSLLASTPPQPHPSVSSDDAAAAEDLKILEAAARHGDRDAQFRIGKRFLNEGGLDGGAATAARWLARAADQGHLEALFTLASLYERGAGVSKDEDRAIDLYRQAAAGGYVRAMHNLAVLLSSRGSAAGYREAGEWFNRAALDGLPDSQYNLALLYERGLGLGQDLARAYFWYRVAAQSGDKDASQQAERLKRSLPPEAIDAAGEQAGSWRPSLEDSRRSANDGLSHRG